MLARILTRVRTHLPALLLALFAIGCGGQRLAIEYDYDYDASFDGLRTWSWIPAQGSETGSDQADKIVREELAAEFERRGFQRVESGADFRAGFLLETDRKITQRLIYTQHGYSYEYYPFDAVGSVDVVVEDYLQGTLIIDVATADGKQPMWRGWAEGVIGEKPTEAEVRSGVREAVRKVLAKFPPPAKRK